jgi:hypothetical protein
MRRIKKDVENHAHAVKSSRFTSKDMSICGINQQTEHVNPCQLLSKQIAWAFYPDKNQKIDCNNGA